VVGGEPLPAPRTLAPGLALLDPTGRASYSGGVLWATSAGRDVALVSDAGTPLVSDPGYRLVIAAQDAGIRISPIPGASAFVAALSVSGLPTDRFGFEGFLPAKPKARRTALNALRGETRTLVFYESVHRIEDFLADAAEAFGGDRPAFVGRPGAVFDTGKAARVREGSRPNVPIS